MDVAEIEKRVDRVIAGSVAVSGEAGGIKFISVIEMMEFAKLMAVSGVAVPAHCRGQPGVCLAIVTQANEWRMSPYAVARMSYMASDNMAFQSQLIHAVVEARAPIKGRLRFETIGEGDERRCKVWATFRGEDKPHEYTSETLGRLRGARGKNDRGQVKGSQMWVDNPEVQLFYSASRQWARLFCPDVILGIYSIDELPDDPTDVTAPQVSKVNEYAQKLRDARASRASTGFDAEKVMRTIIEGEVNPDDAKKEEKDGSATKGGDAQPVDEGNRSDGDGGPVHDRDAAGLGAAGKDDPQGGPQPAGGPGAGEGRSEEGSGAPDKAKPKGKRR